MTITIRDADGNTYEATVEFCFRRIYATWDNETVEISNDIDYIQLR